MTARTEYENRLQARQKSFDQLRRQDDHAVSFRTAVACFGILAIWVVLSWGMPWQILLVPAALFLGALFYHETVKRKQRTAQLAIDHYQRCLQRLDGEWSGIGPDGAEFLDPLHPYAGDLDIFGVGSLFQLLNSPITPSGAKTLAAWLTPASGESLPDSETVAERQNAVRTLREQLDLRERLAVIGPTKQSQSDARELQSWLSNPGGLTAPWVRGVGMLLGVVGIAALLYWFSSGSPSVLILVVFVQLAFLYRLREPLNAIKQHSEQAVFELDRIEQVITALETVAGDDAEINRLRGELVEDNARASETIHQLERTVSQFENMRRNLFVAPLAFISMAALHYAAKIDRWRNTHGRHVNRWFQTVGELETLLAFSQLHFENPEYCFPELTDDAPQFVALGLSHPLLPNVAAIANDVSLSDQLSIVVGVWVEHVGQKHDATFGWHQYGVGLGGGTGVCPRAYTLSPASCGGDADARLAASGHLALFCRTQADSARCRTGPAKPSRRTDRLVLARRNPARHQLPRPVGRCPRRDRKPAENGCTWTRHHARPCAQRHRRKARHPVAKRPLPRRMDRRQDDV